MDTTFNVSSLTETQVANIPYLQKPEPFKGFCVWDYKVVGTSDREPTESEKDAAIGFLVSLPNTPCTELLVARFDSEKAIGREAQVFSGAELIRLMPYSYTLNELIRFKNFWGGVANGVPYDGLKQVLAGLVAGGMILQSDSDKLAGILLEQNIDLGGY